MSTGIGGGIGESDEGGGVIELRRVSSTHGLEVKSVLDLRLGDLIFSDRGGLRAARRAIPRVRMWSGDLFELPLSAISEKCIQRTQQG